MEEFGTSAGDSRLRASHDERHQVIEILETAAASPAETEPASRKPNTVEHLAIKSGVAALAAILLPMSTVLMVTDHPMKAALLAIFVLVLATLAAVLVVGIRAAVLGTEALIRRRKQTPPWSAPGAG